MGASAEFERALISERTKAGLAVARANGRTGGRRPKVTPAIAEHIRACLADGRSIDDLAAQFGLHRAMMYRYAERRAKSRGQRARNPVPASAMPALPAGLGT
jgi:DNA invertase Pin-like site-specific DNA recombinase